jgi:hypothetical protein
MTAQFVDCNSNKQNRLHLLQEVVLDHFESYSGVDIT